MLFNRYRIQKASIPRPLRPSCYQNVAKRYFQQSPASKSGAPDAARKKEHDDAEPNKEAEAEAGAMSRRLEEMTEQVIEQGGQRAQQLVADSGGFSEELKQKLENRILDSKFRDENPQAFAALSMPSSAGQGTQGMAAAAPWTGTESLHDTALRMLDDAHKPLRATGTSTSSRPGPKSAPGATVDLRPRKSKPKSEAQRLRSAIDNSSLYSLSQSAAMTDTEKAETRAQLKERFTPGARSLPATVAGLQSVASQRIEDAIARGQFRNIPRGRGVGVEKDHNASSPFLDTTEYFMNKIIKKQEILPPWVEKQNELTRAATTFRARLRAEWRRHAARAIASKGGGVEEQVRRAEAYARAEERGNPRKPKAEVLRTISSQGNVTTVTVAEEPGPARGAATISVTETTASADSASDATTTVSVAPAEPEPASVTEAASSASSPTAVVAPFRDPAWEQAEHSYHKVAIDDLNSIARSYNLMAPDLAKKPYFDLRRELRACYADVAAQLPGEIRHRAETLRARVEVVGHRPGGLMDKFSAREKVTVYESTRPHYGFKEFWKDVFGGGKERARG